MERPPFEPCREYPRCLSEDRPNEFHEWELAMRHASRLATGQRRRWWLRPEKYTVRCDGRHWIVERKERGQ